MLVGNRVQAVLLIFIMFLGSVSYGQGFKVVLDPGHGGKDPGASYGKFIEKDIVLNVALKVGQLLKLDKNIQVVFTRKTDVFVEVAERTKIANREKADVFISIHVNAAKNKAAFGAETYIMGISKNAANLEVAKRENAVITLEDDYKKHYEGFDPNRPESLIGLTLLQEQFIKQSIDLASKIQVRFKNDMERTDRGVRQGPFWVLHSALMPSILVELGFISNQEEGTYLHSEQGKNDLAKAIARAIIDYKKSNY